MKRRIRIYERDIDFERAVYWLMTVGFMLYLAFVMVSCTARRTAVATNRDYFMTAEDARRPKRPPT
jgi:hypothetical protein